MRRALNAVIVAALLLGAGYQIRRLSAPKARSLAYDLAERLPFASRASSRQTVMFGWPDAEPHIGSGFGGDPESRGRDRFLWARQAATLRLDLKEAHDRVLILDLEAYPGIEDQRLSVSVNGRSLGDREIPSSRLRVRFDWPAASQRPTNELALQFRRAIVPAKTKGGSGDTRDFAAALFSLTLGEPKDDTLDLLRERDTPVAYQISEKDGIPSFILPGMSQTSFAFRLPGDATLEFESALHAWSVASGGKGSLQVAFDSADGISRESVRIPLDSRSLQPARIALNGALGVPFIVRLDVISENPGVTFAQIRAPRIMASALEPEGEPEPPTSSLATALSGLKPNVLLIVLDAARSQSFGAYGHSRDTTPNIDRLAKEGFTFDNAYTTAAYTLAAMSSVWTSQQPDRHHGDVAFSAPIPKDRLLLSEVLTAQGVHTAGFVANSVAGSFNGFDRGFKEFDEPWRRYGSAATGFRNVLPAFLDRMKKAGTPFFGYVHYREPHEPYDPPPPFDTRFGPDSPVPRAHRDGGALAKKWLKDLNQGVVAPSTAEVDHLRRLYDGNLAFADQEVGYLRGELESRGLLANTLVILMGDHGEGLFEHGYIGHNTQVFEEMAHIPLIVVLPTAIRAANPPARVASLVDLTDIAPTILDAFGLAGAGGSGRAFQGRSLLRHLARPDGAPEGDAREVLTRTLWERPIYALRNTTHTFVYNTATTEFSLFDRTSTPRVEDKQHDFASRAPIAMRETYRQNLLAWVASLKSRSVAGDKPHAMSREQCEQLKSLGYLAGAVACPTT